MEASANMCRAIAWELVDTVTAVCSRQKHRVSRGSLTVQLAGKRRRDMMQKLLQGPVLMSRKLPRPAKTPVKEKPRSSPAPGPMSSEKLRPASSQSSYSQDSATPLSFLKDFQDWAETQTSVPQSTLTLTQELLSEQRFDGGKWRTWLKQVSHCDLPKPLAVACNKLNGGTPPTLWAAVSAITLSKLQTLQRLSKPSPEVEVTALAFFLVVAVLEGDWVLKLHSNAWKAFQVYLRQPGKCLQAVKRTATLVKTQSPLLEEDLVARLESQLRHIDAHSLKGVEGSSAALSLFSYLHCLLSLLHSPDPPSIPSPPLDSSPELSPESVANSREKMLSSLYQRTHSVGSLHEEISSEEDSPRLSFGDQDSLPSPYFSQITPEEAAKVEQMVEIALPCYSPTENLVVTAGEREEGAATARFPIREEEEEEEKDIKRSKSTMKMRPGEINDPDLIWTQLIREKMFLCGCIGEVLDLKSSLLVTYRKRLTALLLPHLVVEQMVSRAADPEKYRDEVAKAYLDWERNKQRKKENSGLNWTQSQVRREKMRLERGLQRLIRKK